jgi:2'-5' RNA ligase
VRLFVALELPVELAEALAGWGRVCAARDDALRPVRLDALHLTLAFLGERPEDEVEPLRWALAALAPLGPVPLSLGGPIWLAPRRPHVLACAVEDPSGALAGLHARVVPALAGASGWAPERRPFVPHVTVCRVRGGRHAGGAVRGPGERAFAPSALTLMQSELGSGPPRYTALERVAVTGG